MQVSFKQSPQAARATTKSSDVTRMIYASRAVPMAARNAVVGLIEVADGRSRSALYSGLNRRLERVKELVPDLHAGTPHHVSLPGFERTTPSCARPHQGDG